MGRQARPVDKNQPGDYQMDCRQIERQAQDHRTQGEAQIAKGKAKTVGNVALFTVFLILFWPAVFFMDVKGTDKVEGQAHMERAQRLDALYYERDCDSE
jgi:hypothetical protein